MSAASGAPASQLSIVTFELPHPFMSGARSGDSELSSLIEILEEQHWKNNFVPNQVDLDSTRWVAV